MVDKFIKKNQKDILFCIVDNHDSCQDGWSREISKNLSDFMIFKINQHSYDIFIGSDEDDLLRSAEDYRYAVVIASGTSFKRSDRIFQAIEDKCKEDFFLAGHILDREEYYYELHHQFYIVNLLEYRSLGCPDIGKATEDKHTQFLPEKSVDFLYGEKKIPTYIKPGNILKEYTGKSHGWNILAEALHNGKTLVDLGEKIRNNKRYFYYEYNHVFIKHIPEVFYDQFFCNNFFAGWNSDRVLDRIDFDGPVEQYITVGIGFNWIKNLILLDYNLDTKVVFTDINLSCLTFMEKMIRNWDGKDYTDFYKKNIPRLPNGFRELNEDYIREVDSQWNQFVSKFTSWHEIWNKIRQLKYDFELIDYTSNYDIDWIEPNKKTLINLSNLFNYVSGSQSQSVKYRIACENRLIRKLKDKNPEIILMLTTRAADGFSSDRDRILLGKVSEYNLTDINFLKSPAWHLNEWYSNKILD